MLLYLLIGSYLAGGYWLFQSAPLSAPVRVLSGVGLAVSLLVLPPAIQLRLASVHSLLPIGSGLVIVALIALMRFRHPSWPALWPLLLRAIAVFGISAGFAYLPVTFSPYRHTLLLLNHGQPARTANLRMHGFGARYREAYARQDCASAIKFAWQARQAGQQWLGNDSSAAQQEKISGIYELLFDAYTCTADQQYARQHYAQALRSYRLANRANRQLLLYAQDTIFWRGKQVWGLNNIAYCYNYLQQFTQSDAYFLRAAQTHRRVWPDSTTELALLVGNLGWSQSRQQNYPLSTSLYRQANQLLSTDTTQRGRVRRTSHALAMVLNYMRQDSVTTALAQLHTLRIPTADTSHYYRALLYEGICRFKQNRYSAAAQQLQRARRYYQKAETDAPEKLFIAESFLAYTYLAQARYPAADTLAASLQARLKAQGNAAASHYYQCLILRGAIKEAQGHYEPASDYYAQALRFFEKQPATAERPFPGLYAQLATLHVTLDNLPAARAYAARISLTPVATLSQTPLLLAAARVECASGNYGAARSYYQKAQRINQTYDRHGANYAQALNGLGLVALAENRLNEADSLFAGSLRLYRQLFPGPHPVTAAVYLNYGQLRIRQRQPRRAQPLLREAEALGQATLLPDHDFFGDLALAQGELAQLEKQHATPFFERALTIYQRKFGANHWKTKLALSRVR
ncbi:tetratricopeptide repeat protein [Hymenobacter amundsenii]|uniref:tetratricopeptide repeat protein n=1 Tax=Hymenobacter amundsenii TaxID=2006685 RepID=UPI0013FDF623|nr:tetratricopeptide repeat protein [Hymenobacter amundsenii]